MKPNDKKNLPPHIFEAARILDENKAEDILLLDLHDIHGYLGYFLVATALTAMHLKKLSDEVIYSFKKQKYTTKPPTADDIASGWVILDYGEFLIHLFTREKREFYQIETLWKEAGVIDILEQV